MCARSSTSAASRCRGPWLKRKKRKTKSQTKNGIAWCALQPLTEPMKKSLWITLTMPKFVYMKTLSMIHMMLGNTSCLVLNVVISKGTSAVDWWLTRTSVLWSKHGVMSSPSSTTEKSGKSISDLIKKIEDRTYCHNRPCSSTSQHSPEANGTISLRSSSKCWDGASAMVTAGTSIWGMWEYNKCCWLSQRVSAARPADIWWCFCRKSEVSWKIIWKI